MSRSENYLSTQYRWAAENHQKLSFSHISRERSHFVLSRSFCTVQSMGFDKNRSAIKKTYFYQIKKKFVKPHNILTDFLPKYNFKIIVIYQRICLLNTVCILQLVLKYKSFAECWAIAQISLCENLDYLIIINAEC